MQGQEQLTTTAPRKRSIRRKAATAFGLGCLVCYLGWNVWFLANGQVPASLLRALTGLPAPTSGGTRSFLALLRGDFATSLYYNPMTLPILALLLVTLAQVVWRGCARSWLYHAWVALLLVAWVIKLLSPTATW